MSQAVLELREKVTDIMRLHGVVKASVFGSVARGDEGRGSDVDFLVELESRRTLLDLSGLRLDLMDRLEGILESIRRIEAYTNGVSRADFGKDTEKQDAVVRRLEVIGQAVEGLPQELRELHPQVPWREIAGARDILAHEYFRVDLDLAWDMIQHNVPELKRNVEEILAGMGSWRAHHLSHQTRWRAPPRSCGFPPAGPGSRNGFTTA